MQSHSTKRTISISACDASERTFIHKTGADFCISAGFFQQSEGKCGQKGYSVLYETPHLSLPETLFDPPLRGDLTEADRPAFGIIEQDFNVMILPRHQLHHQLAARAAGRTG